MSSNTQRVIDFSHPALTAALALGLSAPFADLVLGASKQDVHFSTPAALLVPLSVLFLIVFLGYLTLWVLLSPPLQYLLHLSATALTVALATFLGVPVFLLLLLVTYPPPNILENTGILTAVGLVCLTLPPASYFAAKRLCHSRVRPVVLSLAVSAPFILAEIFLFQWASQIARGGLDAIPSPVKYGLLIFLITLSVFFLNRQLRRVPANTLLASFAVVLITACLLCMVTPSRTTGVYSNGPFLEHSVKHVILLTVDTLRSDEISVYRPKSSTPNIQALANDSIVFLNSYSTSPWTKPSFASIMTGTSPWVHRVVTAEAVLPDTLPTMAEFLRDAGYLTAAIGNNAWLTDWGSKGTISRGFLDYNFFPKRNSPLTLALAIASTLGAVDSLREGTTDDLTELAIKWVRSHQEDSFFLWLHYFDPHGPYGPPSEFLSKQQSNDSMGNRFGDDLAEFRSDAPLFPQEKREWVRNLYTSEVRYVDDRIGKFLAVLKSVQLYDDSLIIFTSDHGEEFWDHGSVMHGHTLYNEMLKVPLLVKLPGSSQKHLRVEDTVSNLSILPTILEVCQLDYETPALSAESLRTYWSGDERSRRQRMAFGGGILPLEPVSGARFRPREAVVFDGWKYVEFIDDPQVELFNLGQDPTESRNLAGSHQQVAETGRAALAKHREECARLRDVYAITDPEVVELTDDFIQILRTLGYMK